MHLVLCINISFLYIRQHNNQINNSPPYLCQLSLFNLRYSYVTCFGSNGAIITRYNILSHKILNCYCYGSILQNVIYIVK
jgi:hypothetical protein